MEEYIGLDVSMILARDQRRRHHEVEIVLVEPAFGADLHNIAKAVRREEGRPRPTALDERVGGERRAVDDETDIGETDAGRSADRRHGVEDCLLGVGVVGQQFDGEQVAADLHRDVRERAADVDAKPDVRPAQGW